MATKKKADYLKDISMDKLTASKKSWTSSLTPDKGYVKSGPASVGKPVNKVPQVIQPSQLTKEDTSKPIKKGKPGPKPPKDILNSTPEEIVARTKAEGKKIVRDTSNIVKALLSIAKKKPTKK